jgi:TPR repeat protein
MGLFSRFSRLFESRSQKTVSQLVKTAIDRSVDCSLRMQSAQTLLLAKQYDLAREGYLSIGRDHPDQLGMAYDQIGASYHLQQDFVNAMKYYKLSVEQGYDSVILQMDVGEFLEGKSANE